MTPDAASRVLGVPVGASAEEVRDAFRRLAREVHPDRSPANPEAAAARFIEVTRARDVLLSARPQPAQEHVVYRGPVPSRRLLITWSLLLLVGIGVSVLGSPFPLTPIEPAVRFGLLALAAIAFAVTGRRGWWILMWVAIAATALEVILFTTLGGLMGMLLLAAPLYGLSLIGFLRRRIAAATTEQATT